MRASRILVAYDRLVHQLSEAVTQSDWERLDSLQDDIETLQDQFVQLPEAEKKHPDVQAKLRALLDLQQQFQEQVSQAKQVAARHLRKLKLAKTQQEGYRHREKSVIPPVYYDHKK